MLSDKVKLEIKSSLISSTIAVAATSPLEVLKMNAQVTPRTASLKSLFRDIYHTHGLRGYYKGLGASLGGQPMYWAIYWPVYETLSERYNTDRDLRRKMALVFGSSLIASTTVNPLFVFKTRFQTSVLKKCPTSGQLLYPNLRYQTLGHDIIRNEGIRGLYKGNLVAQIKNTQMVIQMPLFDTLNTKLPLGDSMFPLMDRSFMAGVIAKTVASCVIYYPVDTIRSNIRDQVANKSITTICKEISSRPGGLANFYRGVGIYWLSSVPTFGAIMYVYGRVKKRYIATDSSSSIDGNK